MPDPGREIARPPGLDRAEARVRDVLRDVRPLAAGPLDEVERPLPPGTDHRPAALFLLACEAGGVDPEPVLPFAASIHALDLACRPLARLMGLEDYPPRRSPDDARNDDGLRLLVADGLLIAAHGFLTALEPGAFRALSPLLVDRLGALTPVLEASGEPARALVNAQRLLVRMAARGAALLPGADSGMEGSIEAVVARVDEALAAWRRAEDDPGRAAAVARLEKSAGKPGGERVKGEVGQARRRYVELVLETLALTCGPEAG